MHWHLIVEPQNNIYLPYYDRFFRDQKKKKKYLIIIIYNIMVSILAVEKNVFIPYDQFKYLS